MSIQGRESRGPLRAVLRATRTDTRLGQHREVAAAGADSLRTANMRVTGN